MAADYASYSPYNYVLGNPISNIDPDGRKVEDHIYLNQNGDEIARVENDEPDRYFVETTSTDENGEELRDFIEVNSVQTVKGDLKSQNPWNGSIVDLDVDEIKSMITDVYNELDNEYLISHYAAFVESQEKGRMDFVANFKDGTIYNIGGVHYNSHEGLNYEWGAIMSKMGFYEPQSKAMAYGYHFIAWASDSVKGKDRYKRVGPINEANHVKAIGSGHKLFK